MKKIRVLFGALVFFGGLAMAHAHFAPGDPILDNAYLPGDCQTAIRNDCNGGPQACTFGPNQVQLYWDIEDATGQPAGMCVEEASYTP